MEIDKYNNFCYNDMKANIELDGLKETALLLIAKNNLNEEEENFIRKYCEQAIDNVTYTEDEQIIYNFYIKNIIQKLYYNNQVKELDIRVVFQYLMLQKVKDLNIDIHFKILPDDLYSLEFGEKSRKKSLCCFTDKNESNPTIYIRNSLFSQVFEEKNYLSKGKLMTLFSFIYHEIRHAKQDDIIKQQLKTGIESKEVLIWIKELFLRNHDSNYYYNNYEHYHRECDADLESLFMTFDTLKEYFNYFGQAFIDKVYQKLIAYYNSTRKLHHLTPLENYKSSDDAIDVIDSYIDLIAPYNSEYIYKYLSIQYDSNGQRRSSTDLISEYDNKKQLLEKMHSNDSKLYISKLEALDDLYNYLILGAKEKENKKL